MPVDNIIENVEKEFEKKPKKSKKQAEKPMDKIFPAESTKPASKSKADDNNLFNLIIAVVVILGIIGIVFGYTKDKISEIKKGGNDVTKSLEEQVTVLKQELTSLKDKADILEKENLSNKNVVIDLFDKSRTIPTNVNATGWNILDDKTLGFVVSYPTGWEKVNAVMPPATDAKTKPVPTVVFQPINQPDFLNALTITADYADFAKLTLKEKIEIFSDLDIIDKITFADGRMIYFINLDKNNGEVPTILILTPDNIYRATFNVPNKKLTGYFDYRRNFEEIVATFGLVKADAAAKAQ